MAIAMAVARAGATTRVVLEGDCDENAVGQASARAEANSTAIAVVFATAIAEARANNTEVFTVEEEEQIKVSYV